MNLIRSPLEIFQFWVRILEFEKRGKERKKFQRDLKMMDRKEEEKERRGGIMIKYNRIAIESSGWSKERMRWDREIECCLPFPGNRYQAYSNRPLILRSTSWARILANVEGNRVKSVSEAKFSFCSCIVCVTFERRFWLFVNVPGEGTEYNLARRYPLHFFVFRFWILNVNYIWWI